MKKIKRIINIVIQIFLFIVFIGYFLLGVVFSAIGSVPPFIIGEIAIFTFLLALAQFIEKESGEEYHDSSDAKERMKIYHRITWSRIINYSAIFTFIPFMCIMYHYISDEIIESISIYTTFSAFSIILFSNLIDFNRK